LIDGLRQAYARRLAASRSGTSAKLTECIITPTGDTVISQQRAGMTVAGGDLNGTLAEGHWE